MKRKYTTIIFIFSVIMMLIVAGLFVFVLKVIQNKNEHTSATALIIQNKMMEKENSLVFAEKLAETEELHTFITNHFVDSNKIDVFVDYLENLGQVTGAEVVVRGLETPPKTENILSFRVEIKGTFNEVTKTIVLLENIPYQVNITQIYLSKIMETNTANQEEGVVKNIIKELPEWRGEVSFNILKLN